MRGTSAAAGWNLRSLTVSFRAVPYRENLDELTVIVEADSVSAGAQAKLRRFDVLKAFHIAFPCLNEACQSIENPYRGLPIDGANVGLGLVGPGDLFSHSYRSVPFGSGGSGVQPIRSKSSMVRPNSASTSS